MTVFDHAFQFVIGQEGGLSMNPADPGNWTGGACGKGICRGTKYGIAASAHPELDIAALTLEQAETLYRTAYWTPLQADALPGRVALAVFDAAVNCGVKRAIGWLQSAADCPADGVLGARTLAAVAAKPIDDLLVEFQAQRLVFMAALPSWRVFALGWARRLCRLPYQTMPEGVA